MISRCLPFTEREYRSKGRFKEEMSKVVQHKSLNCLENNTLLNILMETEEEPELKAEI